jgi:hypothetical protein
MNESSSHASLRANLYVQTPTMPRKPRIFSGVCFTKMCQEFLRNFAQIPKRLPTNPGVSWDIRKLRVPRRKRGAGQRIVKRRIGHSDRAPLEIGRLKTVIDQDSDRIDWT